MPDKFSQVKKKVIPAKYLELYIDENGTVNFPNLTKNAVKLAENISGKKQDHLNFYCG